MKRIVLGILTSVSMANAGVPSSLVFEFLNPNQECTQNGIVCLPSTTFVKKPIFLSGGVAGFCKELDKRGYEWLATKFSNPEQQKNIQESYLYVMYNGKKRNVQSNTLVGGFKMRCGQLSPNEPNSVKVTIAYEDFVN